MERTYNLGMEGRMTAIQLEPLDKNNWEACASLKVGANQEDALPSNLFSIAELNFYPQTNAVAILNETQVIVGFATFGVPEDDGAPKIFRLMIDEHHQGKGYGKAALIEIVKELFGSSGANEIQVCYHPKKKELTHFYGTIGFLEKELLPDKRQEEGKMLAILSRSNFRFW
jgi:diamine N-acetyltransferase